MIDIIISAKNIVKKYGNFIAVKDISFEVSRGSFFGFVGPNGAGKTTTISMLSTLLKPTQGDVKVNGFDAVHERDKVRASIGIIFQDPALDIELTAWENLDLHARLYGVNKKDFNQRCHELLSVVELYEKRNLIVKTFSGGMKRRLEIARGLLHYPKVLFLDEPTIGLDPQTRASIWKYIHNIRKKE